MSALPFSMPVNLAMPSVAQTGPQMMGDTTSGNGLRLPSLSQLPQMLVIAAVVMFGLYWLRPRKQSRK